MWADTAYRSKTNEAWLEKHGYFSDIHHKKPKGRPMSERTARANGRRSKIRAFVEHVFAQQKSRMGLFVRTIGIARARTKIGMANLTYNLTRFVWHQGQTGHLQKPVRFQRIDDSLSRYRRRGWIVTREPGLFDVDARLRELSAKGDDLERVNALVDFEAFRCELEQAVPRADRSKGGRPPYDHVDTSKNLAMRVVF